MRMSLFRQAIAVILLCTGLFCLAQAQVPMTGAGKGAPGGAVWTPATLGANLVAWWDVSQPVYTDTGCSTAATNGQNIDCVPDQSGNSLAVNNNFTTQATLNTTGLNSKRTLVFVGSSSSTLVSPSTTTLFNSKTAGSSCVVVTLTGTNGVGFGGYSITGSPPTDPAGAMFMRVVSTGVFAFDYDFNFYANTTISTSTILDLCMVYDGAHITPYVNGVAQTAAPLSSLTFGSGGNVYLSSSGWDGDLSEEILVNSAPAGLAGNFHTYAEAKWGPY